VNFIKIIKGLFIKEPVQIRPVVVYTRSHEHGLNVLMNLGLPAGVNYGIDHLFPKANVLTVRAARKIQLDAFRQILENHRKLNRPMYLLGTRGESYASSDSWFLEEEEFDVYTVDETGMICQVTGDRRVEIVLTETGVINRIQEVGYVYS
jgi:hypothetical protein